MVLGTTGSNFGQSFTVLAEVSGWDTEAKMIARFPLFIEGPAFLVFWKMAEGDKKKKEKVQELMLTSFSLSKGICLSCLSAANASCG